MKQFIARYYIIFILIALFLSPGILAIYAFKHQEILSAHNTNKGVLLHPAIALSELPASSQWHLLYWNPQGCDVDCVQSLTKLAKIRLALGRKLYQVRLHLVQTHNLSQGVLEEIKAMGFEITILKEQTCQKLAKNTNKPIIFIADRKNNAILRYELDAKPEHLFHDLNQLLQGAST
jgi:hypothetical protein